MTQPYEAPDIRLPDTTITVYAGTQSPNCLCMDGWRPQCPQDPAGNTAGGESP